MAIDFTSIGVLLLMFGLLTGIIKLFSNKLPGFSARKLFHMGGGIICCIGAVICPTWKEGCIAASMAVLAVLAMRLTSKSGHDSFLYSGSDEKSFGDILFPLAVLFMVLITRIDRLTFILPVLTLSLADCTAAFIGKAIGKVNLADGNEDRKTAEGSIAFFAVAFAVSVVCMSIWSDMEVYKIITMSFIISLCCTMVEMFASRGTDNILIPASAYLLVKNLPTLETETLVPIAAILGILFIASVVAKTVEVATLYCAVRYAVMVFMALVLCKTHNPIAAPFVVITIVSAMFISKNAMVSSFSTVFFSIACAAFSTAAFPLTMIFAIGNTIILAASSQKETETETQEKAREGREKHESVGNPVVARG